MPDASALQYELATTDVLPMNETNAARRVDEMIRRVPLLTLLSLGAGCGETVEIDARCLQAATGVAAEVEVRMGGGAAGYVDEQLYLSRNSARVGCGSISKSEHIAFAWISETELHVRHLLTADTRNLRQSVELDGMRITIHYEPVKRIHRLGPPCVIGRPGDPS